MKVLALLAVTALVAVASADNFAVLIAGSNTYSNYRHQSDICHAYQILTAHGGIPEENVIVFMYDDIAENRSNPEKGNIINQPDGPNVYEGVKKDYTGSDTTAANVLKVLNGDAEAMKGVGSGRVLESGPDDNVFIYFADHGAPGLVAMPVGHYLYAKDLNKALQNMHDQKRFKELVFYVEACESGSMFENLLPEDINIYATTAASAHQSSYAWYYDEHRRTYLGDEYSVKWMEDTDAHPDEKESLGDQFDYLKSAVTKSQAHEYGDKNMRPEATGIFMSKKYHHETGASVMHKVSKDELEAVSSRDVSLAILLRRQMDTNDQAELEQIQIELTEELNARARADRVHREIVEAAMPSEHVERMMINNWETINWECYPEMIERFEDVCGRMTDYSLQYAYTFVNMCNNGVSPALVEAVAKKIC